MSPELHRHDGSVFASHWVPYLDTPPGGQPHRGDSKVYVRVAVGIALDPATNRFHFGTIED